MKYPKYLIFVLNVDNHRCLYELVRANGNITLTSSSHGEYLE